LISFRFFQQSPTLRKTESNPATALGKLSAMNKGLDPRGRYVMAADGLFEIQPDP